MLPIKEQKLLCFSFVDINTRLKSIFNIAQKLKSYFIFIWLAEIPRALFIYHSYYVCIGLFAKPLANSRNSSSRSSTQKKNTRKTIKNFVGRKKNKRKTGKGDRQKAKIILKPPLVTHICNFYYVRKLPTGKVPNILKWNKLIRSFFWNKNKVLLFSRRS